MTHRRLFNTVKATMNNDFSLSNTSFMQGYSPLKMMEGMPCLYENIPKQKVQINRPKRIRKRKQKELIKKGTNYISKEKVIFEDISFNT